MSTGNRAADEVLRSLTTQERELRTLRALARKSADGAARVAIWLSERVIVVGSEEIRDEARLVSKLRREAMRRLNAKDYEWFEWLLLYEAACRQPIVRALEVVNGGHRDRVQQAAAKREESRQLAIAARKAKGDETRARVARGEKVVSKRQRSRILSGK